MIIVRDSTRVIFNLSGKSSPLHYVPVSILTDCIDGVLPGHVKSHQIMPLLKKPGVSTSDISNFSPITNLNTTGKILERLAMKQLRRHSDHSPNLGHLQSAYRALHSTETAMTKVVSDLRSAVDGGEPSTLLSLDISAAFDTLDHHPLLPHAHELFGFTDSDIKWMQSYLSDPPFLFFIFTTPVGNIIDSFGVTYHQYADDMQLYTTLKLSSSDKLASLSACADVVTS